MPDVDAQEEHQDWLRYGRWLLAALAGLLLFAAAVIAMANPYGNLPDTIFAQHKITDTNQRYQYPAIIRSGQFDSIVIGTSTSRLLRPGALENKFGGHFANLAMDSATAWEQYRLAKLFFETSQSKKTVIIGLDHVWCLPDADTRQITGRGFPEWMFDKTIWNDLPWMLNKRALEISVRRLFVEAGMTSTRIPFDGYEVFVPPDGDYDATRARNAIYKGGKPRPQSAAGAKPGANITSAWRFPALDWLDDLLRLRWRRAILVFTPVHVAALPGGAGYWREQECKAKIAALARRYRVPAVDFRIASAISTRDENYWDDLHYRVPVAERIVLGLAAALETRRDAANGDWKLLNAEF